MTMKLAAITYKDKAGTDTTKYYMQLSLCSSITSALPKQLMLQTDRKALIFWLSGSLLCF